MASTPSAMLGSTQTQFAQPNSLHPSPQNQNQPPQPPQPQNPPNLTSTYSKTVHYVVPPQVTPNMYFSATTSFAEVCSGAVILAPPQWVSPPGSYYRLSSHQHHLPQLIAQTQRQLVTIQNLWHDKMQKGNAGMLNESTPKTIPVTEAAKKLIEKENVLNNLLDLLKKREIYEKSEKNKGD